MLEVSDIWKAYQGEPLLCGVSFKVQADETVCLLGASGSGKSTLLRIIAGLEKPEKGQICWDGQDLAATPPHRRGFGLVFQDYALFPHLTVGRNIGFGLQMLGYKPEEIKTRTSMMLEKVNMAGFTDRRVTELSGGEQQRVALARALASNPRLLMFDEPLGALDRSLREQLMVELRHILRSGSVQAIYVTHDQEEAFTLADRVLLLHEGVIVREGTPAEVWENPGSVWAARFLDAGNVITGVVRGDGKVETTAGIFDVGNDHSHLPGETVTLLIRPSKAYPDAAGELNGIVEDVFFHQDKFKVTLKSGLYFYLLNAVQPGDKIQLSIPRTEIQCLT